MSSAAFRQHCRGASSVSQVKKNALLADFDGTKPVNVSQVRQLSPFRYPGGKTWCVPEVKRWLTSLDSRPRTFVEPFAGGAIVSLTVASEQLAGSTIFSEIDEDVAVVWRVLTGTDDIAFQSLCNEVLSFEVIRENVIEQLAKEPKTLSDKAFRTILKNRVNRGGILAPGASLQKNGENGKGIGSRWYPETLVRRFKAIRSFKDNLSFVQDDAFKVIRNQMRNKTSAFFIDPPYTAGGKRAGARLYAHSEIDHARLFELMSRVRGPFLMTYDDTQEVIDLAVEYNFRIERVLMKSTHHAVRHELLIYRA